MRLAPDNTCHSLRRVDNGRTLVSLLEGGVIIATPKTARPNILYIFTDQQWAGAMSCAGNGDISTPAMDKLAAEGIRF